jgi:ATP-dependent DNA helicase PIF1
MSAESLRLSEEQLDAVARAQLLPPGNFLFITGKAGTGKSVTLSAIRDSMASIVLAPTGLAAVTVGGQTIHSFFGIRPGQAVVPGLPEHARDVLPRIGQILIDEISMVRADLLDMMDAALRRGLESDEPFGGIPIVAFGDLMQIEPVVQAGAERDMLEDRYASPFFFDSHAFAATRAQVLQLSNVFRQSGDARFRDALNDLRDGGVECLCVFNERAGAEPEEDAIRITLTNARAKAINDVRLNALEGEAARFQGVVTGNFGRELPTDLELDLKIGARVMCLHNNREGDHFNGDLGVVVGMEPRLGFVTVELDRGPCVTLGTHSWEKLAYRYSRENGVEANVEATFSQIPLKLAWATTVHKAQGQTFDRIHLELERAAFAHGQTYVALSRCRTLAGMSLGRRVVPQDVICRKRVRDWCREVGI